MGGESRAMRRYRRVLMIILEAVVLIGCRPGGGYLPGGNVQTGTASWYGGEFHGKRTSSREVYDMNDLTAAHNTLPLGTFVAVTNLNNGQSVVVRLRSEEHTSELP